MSVGKNLRCSSSTRSRAIDYLKKRRKSTTKKGLYSRVLPKEKKTVKCPYPGCGNPVIRVDLHLKSVHKVKGDEFDKYNKMAKDLHARKKRKERKESEKVFPYSYLSIKT